MDTDPKERADGMPEDRSSYFAWGPDILLSQCMLCKQRVESALVCKAFLSYIPDEIITNDFDHRKPWIDPETGEAGDQGFDLNGSILFEPREEINPVTLSVLYRHLDSLPRP